jgi:hypothetical protein
VKDRFGIERVVFIGDRGMITEAKVKLLKQLGVGFITALRPNSVGRARRASFWWRWSVGVRSRSVDGPCGERDRRLGRR